MSKRNLDAASINPTEAQRTLPSRSKSRKLSEDGSIGEDLKAAGMMDEKIQSLDSEDEEENKSTTSNISMPQISDTKEDEDNNKVKESQGNKMTESVNRESVDSERSCGSSDITSDEEADEPSTWKGKAAKSLKREIVRIRNDRDMRLMVDGIRTIGFVIKTLDQDVEVEATKEWTSITDCNARPTDCRKGVIFEFERAMFLALQKISALSYHRALIVAAGYQRRLVWDICIDSYGSCIGQFAEWNARKAFEIPEDFLAHNATIPYEDYYNSLIKPCRPVYKSLDLCLAYMMNKVYTPKHKELLLTKLSGESIVHLALQNRFYFTTRFLLEKVPELQDDVNCVGLTPEAFIKSICVMTMEDVMDGFPFRTKALKPTARHCTFTYHDVRLLFSGSK